VEAAGEHRIREHGQRGGSFQHKRLNSTHASKIEDVERVLLPVVVVVGVARSAEGRYRPALSSTGLPARLGELRARAGEIPPCVRREQQSSR
jgi:hypothetical protein